MKKVFVYIFIVLLFYTRFVSLDWGLPYPMHPDERNMANAIQGMSCNSNLSECLNPHFFAYGQLPLYLAYGGISLQHFFSHSSSPISFNEATLALRALSSFASILLVFVLFKTFFLFVDKKHIKSHILKVGIFMLLVFSPFAIQFAHFGTTESLLMLFYSSLLYFCLLLWKNRISTTKFVVITGILSGLSLGTKTSSALFLGLPIILAFIKMVGGTDGGDPNGAHIGQSPRSTGGEEGRGRIYHFFFILIFFLFLTLICFCLSSPQSFINWDDFISSMTYESSIGMGKYVPFYTRQFVHTTPLLFQIENILPYALGWPQFLLGVLGFFLLPIKIKTKQQKTSKFAAYINQYNILRVALLLVFLPSAFFFAKWTRFIAPSFPLFSLCAVLFLYQLFKRKRSIFIIILLISFVPGIAYLSVYRAPDVRFTASEWMYKNIPTNSKILSETANVVDLPIPSTSSSNPEHKYFQIASFDFYDVDTNPELQKELPLLVNSADYIIIPSRRIFKNHSRETYPILNEYYEKLFSGESGFVKVAEFSSYPHITLFGHTLFELPDENSEETWTVFDHPVIRIYKRTLNSDSTKIDYTNYQTINYRIEATNYHLLVADTAEKWEKGLMYVKNKQDIGGFDGMIFTFPDIQIRTFWNKNTLSDLTLYWIEKKKVIGMSSMPSITKTGSVVTFSSPGPADNVIEIIR